MEENSESKEVKQEPIVKTIDDILKDPKNYAKVYQDAMSLYKILLGKRADVNDCDNFVFTRTEVVKKTTLSHSKASGLLELLKTFNFIKYETKNGFEFSFTFTDNQKIETLMTEINTLSAALNFNIERCKMLIIDMPFEKEEIKTRLSNFKKQVKGLIKF